jgi:hypothetical protein
MLQTTATAGAFVLYQVQGLTSSVQAFAVAQNINQQQLQGEPCYVDSGGGWECVLVAVYPLLSSSHLLSLTHLALLTLCTLVGMLLPILNSQGIPATSLVMPAVTITAASGPSPPWPPMPPPVVDDTLRILIIVAASVALGEGLFPLLP